MCQFKITEKGKEFIHEPYEILLTEDHDYDAINAKNAAASSQKVLLLILFYFNNLKDLRKNMLRKRLTLNIIFSEASLIDMSNQYPITDELAQIYGVGQGKAKSLENHF